MVKWLGFMPCPTHGIIVVQRSKLLRAILFIHEALAGTLAVCRFRALLGFLEHLKVLLDKAKMKMFGLYRPLTFGNELTTGPATLVRIDNRMRGCVQVYVFAC